MELAATSGTVVLSSTTPGTTVEKQRKAGSPLAIILSPSGTHNAAKAGEQFDLHITVVNQGDHEAVVELSIDESAIVREWCLTPYEKLAIGPQQSCEVLFRFQIPVQTLPDRYPYYVVVDSPDHYPEDTPIQTEKSLRVLPQAQVVAQVEDATFTVQPLTTSQQRAQLLPGSELSLTLQIQNRSNRVDRFHLTCPDLEDHWWQVRYPTSMNTLGVQTTESSLPLNPDSQGEIEVSLRPPFLAEAGVYTPTLQIHSDNCPHLALLSPVYFDVTSIYDIDIICQPLAHRSARLLADYQLVIHNAGNTTRQLNFLVQPLDKTPSEKLELRWNRLEDLSAAAANGSATLSEAMTLDQALLVFVPPQQTQTLNVQINSTEAWRRPWRGGGRSTEFAILVEDSQQHPLPVQQFPGRLLWQTRPRWHFLLLAIAGLSAIGALCFLVWWLVLLPLRPPRITSFSAAQARYQESEGQPVRLQWQVRRPQKLDRLRVVGQSLEGEIISEPTTYEMSEGLPAALAPYCSLSDRTLACANVPTDARQAGTYQFELQLFTHENEQTASMSKQANAVTVAPILPPKIASFSSQLIEGSPISEGIFAALEYVQPNTTTVPTSWVAQNWQISNAADLQSLTLSLRTALGNPLKTAYTFDFAQGIPDALKPFCSLDRELVCRNLPLPAPSPGTYAYQLAASSLSSNGESVATQLGTQITLETQPPKILSFNLNGAPATPKYIFSADSTQEAIALYFTWEVEPQPGLDVQILPTPGTVGTSGDLYYYLAQEPGSTLLTLKATSADGKVTLRTVEFQVLAPEVPMLAPISPVSIESLSDSAPANSPREPIEQSQPASPTSRAVPAAQTTESTEASTLSSDSAESTGAEDTPARRTEDEHAENAQLEQQRPSLLRLLEGASRRDR